MPLYDSLIWVFCFPLANCNMREPKLLKHCFSGCLDSSSWSIVAGVGQATGLAWSRRVKWCLLPEYIIHLIIFMIHLTIGFVYHFPLLGNERWLVSPLGYLAYKIFCHTVHFALKNTFKILNHIGIFLWPFPYVSFGGALWSPEMFLYLIEIKSGFHFTFLNILSKLIFCSSS